jgi:signal transduction histidine kinase/DNA-binding response OmpR family regulator
VSMTATTLIVLAANGITAIWCAALLMLVLWQAPRQRANQYFGITMFTLGAYVVANGLGRFIDELLLDAADTTYAAITIYGMFVVSMFFFASEFAQDLTTTTRFMRLIGVILVAVQSVALWTDNVMVGIAPSTTDHGSYHGEWTSIGQIAAANMLIYLFASSIVLYHMQDERVRSLWPAPALAGAGSLFAIIVWPSVPLPLNALFLTGAAAALGLPVLRHEVFNPRANLFARLAEKNEELEEANRLKSEFLATMSHEMRTPLNSIIGYAQLVVNGNYGVLNETQRDRLEKVIRNGYNLLGLINDVLDLNRIESGRVTLERHSIATPDLLESVLMVIEPLAQQKGLLIRREFKGCPPVFGDEMRIRQIVTNILANAVKFTDHGSIAIRASRAANVIKFEFADTGIGIHPDQFETVFAEFRQVDSSSTRRHEGTGLGLAITRRLVEMHGGHIWLESMPGRGTTFYVTLPAASTGKTGPLARVVPRKAHGTAILTIVDNPDARDLLVDRFAGEGYRALASEAAADGLALAREHKPDAVVVDIMLPGLDGWQVLHALKSDPTTRHIPVIIVSAIDNRPLALCRGADDALIRPLNEDRLLAAVDRAAAGGPPRAPVLIVSGQREELDRVAALLQDQGYATQTAQTGAAAFDWMRDNVPRLLLLDLLLPEAAGLDVLVRVQKDARLFGVPVIVMTPPLSSAEQRAWVEQRHAKLIEDSPDSVLRAVREALAAQAEPAF